MSDTPRPPQTYRPSQLLDEGIALAKRAYEARSRGIVHGPGLSIFPTLAKEICGSIPPGLTVLLGPPGSGKSALAGQIADGSEVPTLVATFEMSPLELLRRSASRINDTFTSKYRDGTLSPDEWQRQVEKAVLELGHLAYLDGTRDNVSWTDLHKSLSSLRRELGDGEYALLVVDSVSAWARSAQGNETENEAVTSRLRELQKLASEPGVSVLAIGEQNRANRDTDKQEAGAGSRVFEYGAEVLMTLKRGEEDAEGVVDVDLILAKNRLGRAGKKISMRFEGAKMRFAEGLNRSSPSTPAGNGSTSSKLARTPKNHSGKTG
jgi:replicative DNA helicase